MKKTLISIIFLLTFFAFQKVEAYSECNFSFTDKLPQQVPYTHTNGITYDAVIPIAGDTGNGGCSTTKYAIYVKTSAQKPYFTEINQNTISLTFPNSPVAQSDYVIYATSTNGGDTWSSFSSSIGNILSYDLDGTQRIEYHYKASTNLFFASDHDYDFILSEIERFGLGSVTAGQLIVTASAFGMEAPSAVDIPAQGTVGEGGNLINTINSYNEDNVLVEVTHQAALDGGTAHVRITDSLGAYVEGSETISGSSTTVTTVSGIDASSLADGDLTITARVEDASSNFSDWSSGTSGTKDATAPSSVANLTSNLDEDEWEKENDISFSWSASTDDGIGLAGYSYVLDHESDSVPDVEVESSAGSYEQDDSDNGDDWYFHIRSVDSWGNASGVTHLGPFKIDTKLPDVDHDEIDELDFGDDLTIKADVDDDGLSGIEKVEVFYRLDGGDWEDSELHESSDDNYRKTLDVKGEAKEKIEYYLRVEDKAGNVVYVYDGGKTEKKSKAKDDPIKIKIVNFSEEKTQSVVDFNDYPKNIISQEDKSTSEVAGVVNDEKKETNRSEINEEISSQEEESGIFWKIIIGFIILIIIGVVFWKVWQEKKQNQRINKMKIK